MRVLHLASEASPFAKTGGLADVAGALPEALAGLGCDVTLVLPAYREVFAKQLPVEPTGIEFDVPIGTRSSGIARFLSWNSTGREANCRFRGRLWNCRRSRMR